jgi:hypothetical protein
MKKRKGYKISVLEDGRINNNELSKFLGGETQGCTYNCAPTFHVQCAWYTSCIGTDVQKPAYSLCIAGTDIFEVCNSHTEKHT